MNINSNFVSVLICSNKFSVFTKDALDSIFHQSHKNIEVVIVLNCISDEHFFSYKKYLFDKKCYKLLRTNICQLSSNLNFGLNECSYGYICRMDDDDISEINRIEKLLDAMDKFQCDVVGSNAIVINETGQVVQSNLHKNIVIKDSDIKKVLAYKNPMIHPSVLYKKDNVLNVGGYLGGFVSEDYDLWLRLASSEAKFHNLSDNLLKYRVHSNQSKGSCRAYAEISGYLIRSLLLDKKTTYLFGFILNIMKFLVCKVKSK